MARKTGPPDDRGRKPIAPEPEGPVERIRRFLDALGMPHARDHLDEYLASNAARHRRRGPRPDQEAGRRADRGAYPLRADRRAPHPRLDGAQLQHQAQRLGKYLGDATLAAAILDRLALRATRIDIDGTSYRQHIANERAKARGKKSPPEDSSGA
jgi:hypothetical protein